MTDQEKDVVIKTMATCLAFDIKPEDAHSMLFKMASDYEKISTMEERVKGFLNINASDVHVLKHMLDDAGLAGMIALYECFEMYEHCQALLNANK